MAIVHAKLSDKPLLAEMMVPYVRELAGLCDWPLSESSFVPDQYFDLYWDNKDRHPFLIQSANDTVGFCLVREVGVGGHGIAEFYVALSHRRGGAGMRAALEVFGMFPGRWQVAQLQENVVAQKFWRKAIGEFTDGNFDESWSDNQPRGPMQVFIA